MSSCTQHPHGHTQAERARLGTPGWPHGRMRSSADPAGARTQSNSTTRHPDWLQMLGWTHRCIERHSDWIRRTLTVCGVLLAYHGVFGHHSRTATLVKEPVPPTSHLHPLRRLLPMVTERLQEDSITQSYRHAAVCVSVCVCDCVVGASSASSQQPHHHQDATLRGVLGVATLMPRIAQHVTSYSQLA